VSSATISTMRSLDRIPGRTWTAWRSPGRFTKNPDVVALPDGRLLAVYADVDKHWAEGIIELTLIQSVDSGRTWAHAGVVARSDRSRREPHWVTPRISRLSTGRLAITCDLDDFEHAHEFQAPGIFLWWSDDLGKTWSDPVNTGVPGIEPDRIIELPDGRLSMGSHMAIASTQKLTEFISRSADGGRSWGPPVKVAGDSVHLYCEGAYLVLADGTLVCVLRDNLHQNYPSRVCFSFDSGDTWTVPRDAPFAGDRPFIGQIPDGRILATYRHMGGTRGTHAWLGHLQHELGYRVSSVHRHGANVTVTTDDGLRIHQRSPATTQYNLLPPESYRSSVLFHARVRVGGTTGSDSEVCAVIQLAHVGVRLRIMPGGVSLGDPDLHHVAVDRTWAANMTEWHDIRIRHDSGLVRVWIDGVEVLRYRLVLPGPFVPTFFGSETDGTGTSQWQHVTYDVRNHSDPDWSWIWDARSGLFPDQYILDRMIELHPNTHRNPDNGYSSWLPIDDDQVLVLDYTNEGDPLGQSHVIGCDLRISDFDRQSATPPA